jgi:hypothetical protein
MTLRNAPRVGQDAGSCRSDLPDGLSEIFLQKGLDRKTTDLPDGQISPLFTVIASLVPADWPTLMDESVVNQG